MIDKSKLSVYGLFYHGYQRDHGSFFSALFDAFGKASTSNKQRIANAFPEYFNEYDVSMDYPIMVNSRQEIIDRLPRNASHEIDENGLFVTVFKTEKGFLMDSVWDYCQDHGIMSKITQHNQGTEIPSIIRFLVFS